MARTKKEDPFFTLLKEHAAKVVEGAEIYRDLTVDYEANKSRVPEVKIVETECDQVVREIMERLYTEFITPIDREDISDLALALDDVIDDLTRLSLRYDLFNIQDMRPEATRLGRLIYAAVSEVKVMIDHFPDYKDDPQVMKSAMKISDIEDEGDSVYEDALRTLFRDDIVGERATVAWLRLFDRMEGVLGDCDKVGNVVRNVVMKGA